MPSINSGVSGSLLAERPSAVASGGEQFRRPCSKLAGPRRRGRHAHRSNTHSMVQYPGFVAISSTGATMSRCQADNVEMAAIFFNTARRDGTFWPYQSATNFAYSPPARPPSL